MSSLDEIVVVAPGRICLFGEHQDFLGLRVIACAINLHITIRGKRRKDRLFIINMPDIGETDTIDISQPITYRKKRDYMRSCLNVVLREGYEITCGYDVEVRGNIPINAGTSSSSALVTAWTKFLLTASGSPDADDPIRVARLAHRAEVLEFKEPGGMMDHFTSSVGGTISVDCKEPFEVERLNVQLTGLVLGDSLERKQTLDVLRSSKEDVLRGIRQLKEWIDDFDLRETPTEVILSYARKLEEPIRRKVVANVYNRDICLKALEMLRRGDFDPAELGRLLLEHQAHLRDGLDVSTKKIDAMIEAAMAAGALGGKINGSGGGGCMFAYAPGKEEAVARAIEEVGGVAYIVHVDPGARLLTPR
jgi:galactokinase